MFDHLSLGVSQIAQSIAFYDATLSPLGIKRLFNLPNVAAYGTDSHPMFWINHREGNNSFAGFHLAFQATDRASVDAFYQAAIAAGATDDGKPGVRSQYHPNYYAAFVIDPDGYRIEAVCHQ
ncbi:hypothetical protein LEP3755_55080 [Leptolyngbya sp. NIES-3755]|nr:hypothetical protein LEP3755_55080 [Leptolyngbya sp. NIES-3755]